MYIAKFAYLLLGGTPKSAISTKFGENFIQTSWLIAVAPKQAWVEIQGYGDLLAALLFTFNYK